MSFKNKRFVIIGGTSGIGLEVAKAAHVQGAHIIVTGYKTESLKAIEAQIGENSEAHNLDIGNEDAVKNFFAKVGKLDYLTTPGGIVPTGPFLELDSETAHIGMNSKFWGQYYAAKYATPNINEGGAIVFFGGVIAHRPKANLSVMASVNSAVEGLGRALSVELAPIRVNVLSPGIIDTPRYSAMPAADREAMFKAMAEKLPVKHVGKPDELAQAVLFLMQNTFTTGQTIYVDGGHQLV